VMVRRGAEGVLGRIVDDLCREGRILAPQAAAVVRPMPLGPLSRTYGDRVLAVGDAAGLVKPTTGGGIYYGLLSAAWAAETLARAFERGDFSARCLSRYEDMWRERLGRELRIGTWFRRLASRMTAAEIDVLVELAVQDGVAPVLRQHARFDWHASLILGLVRHPGVLKILAQRVMGGQRALRI
jgi:digeranylgeranylglycerophospholipid reductase